MNARLDQGKCSSWAAPKPRLVTALLAVLALASPLPAHTDRGPASTSTISVAADSTRALQACTSSGPECLPQSIALHSYPQPDLGDKSGEYPKNPPLAEAVKKSGRPDF